MAEFDIAGGGGGGCEPYLRSYFNTDPNSGGWVDNLGAYPVGVWTQLSISNPSVCVVTVLPDVCDTIDATFQIIYPAIRMYIDTGTNVGLRGKYRINGGSWVAPGNPTLYRAGPIDETYALTGDSGIVHPGPSGAIIEAAVEAYVYTLGGTINYLISSKETRITAEALGV